MAFAGSLSGSAAPMTLSQDTRKGGAYFAPGSWGARLFRTRPASALTSEHLSVSGVDAEAAGHDDNELARHLGPWDLTALGVGATLGSGVYVITGVVAATKAGPAIILSFVIAGLASILSGLAYAEFASRVPLAGSAYAYSYVSVGEAIAFFCGWNMILEYVIGTAAVARAWSGYADTLANHAISSWVSKEMGGWEVPGLGNYPDFGALLITLLLSAVVALGVRESARFNNAMTFVNMCVIIFVVVAGALHLTYSNWAVFMPFGWSGVFSGASTAFYAFVGFDTVATTAEEAINPSRNLPIGIIGSLVICMVAYVGVSGVITLMVDYPDIDQQAPLAVAFGQVGMSWAKSVIAVGAICGLSTSLMSAIFPMPRVIYSIAGDGLLWPWLGKVSKRFRTPVNATVVCGSFAGLLAWGFNISELANMMSIGTLMAYTLVSVSVLVLRYRREPGVTGKTPFMGAAERAERVSRMRSGDASGATAASSGAGASARNPLLGGGGGGDPAFGYGGAGVSRGGASGSGNGFNTADLEALLLDVVPILGGRMWVHPERAAIVLVSLFSLAMTVFAITMQVAAEYVADFSWWVLVLLGLCVAAMLATGTILYGIPTYDSPTLKFKCPWVPVLPLCSVVVNLYLIFSLDKMTWVRFGVWLVFGTAIYFFYGIHHSKAGLAQAAAQKASMRPRGAPPAGSSASGR